MTTSILALDLGNRICRASVGVCSDLQVTSINALRWREVPGWPEYEISEYGDVRRRMAGGSPIAKPGKLLRPSGSGYRHVNLHGGAGRQHISLHRLVALAFIGEPPSCRHQVAHNDGDRLNNHYTNLRYATPRENAADRVRHGTQSRGETAGPVRLTEVAVRQIRALADRGVPQDLIAEIFETSQSHIGRVVRGEAWGHVQ